MKVALEDYPNLAFTPGFDLGLISRLSHEGRRRIAHNDDRRGDTPVPSLRLPRNSRLDRNQSCFPLL